jgi:tetratricopeptide (TPR) repeat protein
MASVVGTRVALGAVGLVAVVLSVGLTAATAHAEDKSAAKDHWERGTKFYDIGKYDDAIKEFEAAYEAKSDPAFLYNLAQSHRLAGHPNEALRLYRTYLRYVPKAPNRADIDDRIKELEKAAAEKPTSDTTSPTSPATPPPTQPTTPATPPATTTTPPTMGTTPPATTWPPPAGTDPNAPPPGTPPGAGSYPGAAPMGPPPSEQPVAAGSGRRKVGMIIGGTGVGLMVVGAIFGGVTKSQSNKVEKAATYGERFDPSVESLGKTAEVLQYVGYGLGLAGLATGLFLYLTAPAGTEASAPPPPVAVAPLAGPGLGGALVQVAF